MHHSRLRVLHDYDAIEVATRRNELPDSADSRNAGKRHHSGWRKRTSAERRAITKDRYRENGGERTHGARSTDAGERHNDVASRSESAYGTSTHDAGERNFGAVNKTTYARCAADAGKRNRERAGEGARCADRRYAGPRTRKTRNTRTDSRR